MKVLDVIRKDFSISRNGRNAFLYVQRKMKMIETELFILFEQSIMIIQSNNIVNNNQVLMKVHELLLTKLVHSRAAAIFRECKERHFSRHAIKKGSGQNSHSLRGPLDVITMNSDLASSNKSSRKRKQKSE
jgi:hypothetical protein